MHLEKTGRRPNVSFSKASSRKLTLKCAFDFPESSVSCLSLDAVSTLRKTSRLLLPGGKMGPRETKQYDEKTPNALCILRRGNIHLPYAIQLSVPFPILVMILKRL